MELGFRLFVLVAVFLSLSSGAEVFSTVDQTLKKLFPTAKEPKEKHLYLSKEEMKIFNSKEGLVTYYVVQEAEKSHHAYVDTHVVRTAAESILVVLSDDTNVEHIEVLGFSEPKDYMASSAWLAQFHHKTLKDVSAFKSSIRPITGATLTSDAITKATARVLALHQKNLPRK